MSSFSPARRVETTLMKQDGASRMQSMCKHISTEVEPFLADERRKLFLERFKKGKSPQRHPNQSGDQTRGCLQVAGIESEFTVARAAGQARKQ